MTRGQDQQRVGCPQAQSRMGGEQDRLLPFMGRGCQPDLALPEFCRQNLGFLGIHDGCRGCEFEIANGANRPCAKQAERFKSALVGGQRDIEQGKQKLCRLRPAPPALDRPRCHARIDQSQRYASLLGCQQ